jgi:hypothetical protein
VCVCVCVCVCVRVCLCAFECAHVCACACEPGSMRAFQSRPSGTPRVLDGAGVLPGYSMEREYSQGTRWSGSTPRVLDGAGAYCGASCQWMRFSEIATSTCAHECGSPPLKHLWVLSGYSTGSQRGLKGKSTGAQGVLPRTRAARRLKHADEDKDACVRRCMCLRARAFALPHVCERLSVLVFVCVCCLYVCGCICLCVRASE